MKRTQHQLSISTSADEYDGMRLARETDDHVVLARFSLTGEPVSKSRARFTKRGSKVLSYTPEKTLQAEKAVALAFRAAYGPGEPDDKRTFGVMAVFKYSHRQRRDVDNMIKLLLDGLNKVAWQDDVQVTEVCGRKEFVPPGKEGTDVVVYSVGSIELRTAKCERCGKQYRTYPSWEKVNKRHCSDDCRLAQRRSDRMITCQHCGIRWDPGKPSDAKYCSKTCMAAHSRVDVSCDHCGETFNKPKYTVRKTNYCSDECRRLAINLRHVKTRKGDCTECGGPVSRREYVRCAKCNAAMRKVGGRPVKGALPIQAGELADTTIAYVTPAGREIEYRPGEPMSLRVEISEASKP